MTPHVKTLAAILVCGVLEACIANPTDLAVATMRAAVEE